MSLTCVTGVGAGTSGPDAARLAIARAQHQMAKEANVHLHVRNFSVSSNRVSNMKGWLEDQIRLCKVVHHQGVNAMLSQMINYVLRGASLNTRRNNKWIWKHKPFLAQHVS